MDKKKGNSYKEFTDQVLSRVPENERGDVARVLSTEKAQETYSIMEENKVPKNTMRRIMLHGIKDIARGKSISIGAYTSAIAEELTKYDQYTDVIDDMREEGVLSERQYKSVKHEIDKSTKGRAKILGSDLEKFARAAVYLILFLGIVLMLSSTPTITGAVTGTARPQSSLFVIGFIVFTIGLFLNYRNK